MSDHTFEQDVVLSAMKDGLLDVEARRKNQYCPLYLQEKKIPFSQADPSNLMIASALGIVNLLGTISLGSKLTNIAYFAQTPKLYVVLSRIFPPLLGFAILYNAIPLARWFMLKKQNDEIAERNNIRSEW
jgi:hypothetical protein